MDLCTGAAAASMDDDEVARMSSNTCGNRCIGDEPFLSLKSQNSSFQEFCGEFVTNFDSSKMEHRVRFVLTK